MKSNLNENPELQRREPRYHTIEGKFPGKLNCQGKPLTLATHSIDVSREGMGILTESHLLAGDIVELTVGDKTISLEVVYCLMDLIHRGKFRSGLRRVKSSENLLDVFKKHGCL